MNTPQDINATLAQVTTALAEAQAKLATVQAAFDAHAVAINEGDLMLDAMAYAVSQSSDPDWQADVRALIAKLTGMDTYQTERYCEAQA